MIVLDTNIISEVHKANPDRNVMAWLDEQEPTNLYLTAITAEELLFGATILPPGRRRADLIGIVGAILEDDFRGRILPYDVTAADYYAMRVAAARCKGVTIGHSDGQIGGIVAAQKGAFIATRDEAPFAAMGLKVLNPWHYRG